MDENQVLCACSAYEQKFYLNPRYESLPEGIKEELKILSAMLDGRCRRCVYDGI